MLNQPKDIQKIRLILAVIIFGATFPGCSMIKNSANNGTTNTTNTTNAANSADTTKTTPSPSPVPTAENTKTQETSQKPDKNVIAIGSLLAEFKKSPADTRKKYDGKEITVRGFVISATTIDESDADTSLIGIREQSNYDEDLSCWFKNTDVTESKKIKGMQFVTVKGIFDGELSFPQLQFCKVVKIEPEIAD